MHIYVYIYTLCQYANNCKQNIYSQLFATWHLWFLSLVHNKHQSPYSWFNGIIIIHKIHKIQWIYKLCTYTHTKASIKYSYNPSGKHYRQQYPSETLKTMRENIFISLGPNTFIILLSYIQHIRIYTQIKKNIFPGLHVFFVFSLHQPHIDDRVCKQQPCREIYFTYPRNVRRCFSMLLTLSLCISSILHSVIFP